MFLRKKYPQRQQSKVRKNETRHQKGGLKYLNLRKKMVLECQKIRKQKKIRELGEASVHGKINVTFFSEFLLQKFRPTKLVNKFAPLSRPTSGMDRDSRRTFGANSCYAPSRVGGAMHRTALESKAMARRQC